MEYQGTPLGGAGDGTKVTSDPRSNDRIHESTGGVAKDSLAAESYRQGGGFAENHDAEPSSVSGSASTWNNSDTSSATTLDAASSAPFRDDNSGSTKYPESTGGQGQFSGRHNDGSGGYSGGPSGNFGSSKDTTGAYSSSGADTYDSSNADAAPSYTLNTAGANQHTKPKGNNITEGGFTGEGSNITSDIGTRDDPGRQAVQGFAKSAARADPSGPTQYGRAGNEQPFDALNSNERA